MARTFEIGVVMAGAISAGAYTAGVIDFLFEALDDYYAARDRADWDGPRHDVRVPILSGASAGGMTAAIAGLHAFRDFTPAAPAAPPPPPEQNRLYSSWVQAISIERLLETTDLKPRAGMPSALCCDVLDEIVADAFEIAGPLRRRAWIGRDGDPTLRLRLTLTNTRGVPYAFKVFGQDAAESFGMLDHADFQEFAIGEGAAPGGGFGAGATGLDAADFQARAWAILRQAALATGALSRRPPAAPDPPRRNQRLFLTRLFALPPGRGLRRSHALRLCGGRRRRYRQRTAGTGARLSGSPFWGQRSEWRESRSGVGAGRAVSQLQRAAPGERRSEFSRRARRFRLDDEGSGALPAGRTHARRRRQGFFALHDLAEARGQPLGRIGKIPHCLWRHGRLRRIPAPNPSVATIICSGDATRRRSCTGASACRKTIRCSRISKSRRNGSSRTRKPGRRRSLPKRTPNFAP